MACGASSSGRLMAKLAVKPGTQPPLLYLAVAVANVAMTYGDIDVVTLTAGVNGQHASFSLHYSLRALDVRSKNFDGHARKLMFVADLRRELAALFGGPLCDVILEKEGTEDEHVHLEFDPKSPHVQPAPTGPIV